MRALDTQSFAASISAVSLHALREAPRQCCGLIASDGGLTGGTRYAVYEGDNIQNHRHGHHPELHPLDNRGEYFMHPAEMAGAFRDARERGLRIAAIYHSHVEQPPAFTEADIAAAVYEGDPIHPGVAYIVMSVTGIRVSEIAVYQWDEASRAYIAQA